MRNDWTIEINLDHTTGAAKIRKQTKCWRGLISTQKIKVETSKNICTIEINQEGHRGKYLLLEELRSPWDLSITSHESDRQ